jgi:tetratricopeptide (TPR) repeat protein
MTIESAVARADEYIQKSKACLEEAKFKSAVENAQTALDLMLTLYEEDDVELMESYGQAGMAYSLGAYSLLSKGGDESVYLDSDKLFAHALHYYNNALAIAEKHFGEESTQVAMLCCNMGSVYRLMDDDWAEEEYYIKAIGIYSTAVDKVRDELGDNCIELAELYEHLSMVYKNMDCTKEMMSYIERADKIYELLGVEHEHHHHEHGEECT